jgi:hypothetical protein
MDDIFLDIGRFIVKKQTKKQREFERESRCLSEVHVRLFGTQTRSTAAEPHTNITQDDFDHKLAEYKKTENRTQPFSASVGNQRTRLYS